MEIPPCIDVVFVGKVDVVCITHVSLYWKGPELILVYVNCNTTLPQTGGFISSNLRQR